MSPALAVRRAQAHAGDYWPAAVHRPKSPIVHVGSWTRLRRPLCGQRGKRFAAPRFDLVARKRLCGRCARVLEARTPAVDLGANLEALATELVLARTEAEVVALRPAVIAAGPTVVYEGRVMHARYADALTHVRKASA